MNQDWLLTAAALAICYLVLVSIRLRREAIRFQLRRLLLVGVAYITVIAYLRGSGWAEGEAILGGIIAGLVTGTLVRKRSRYVPRAEKKKTIARFELRTGKKFSPSVHEIDHLIPFSKGGSNTADNLRVVSRRENRSKGAKSPWWDLLGRSR